MSPSCGLSPTLFPDYQIPRRRAAPGPNGKGKAFAHTAGLTSGTKFWLLGWLLGWIYLQTAKQFRGPGEAGRSEAHVQVEGAL